MVMQNPLLYRDYKDSEGFDDYINSNDASIINTHKVHLWKWLSSNNKSFLDKFIELLNKHQIIEYKI